MSSQPNHHTGHSPWNFLPANRRLLLPLFILLLVIAAPSAAFGQGCGGNGQRACCNGDGEFSNTGFACNGGAVYVNGCTDPHGCSCSGGIITSENSLGMCYTPAPCGGPGQRGCCNGAGEFSNNGTACNGSLVQIPGCDSSGGAACVCGGGTFFASGTCVAPNAACGGKGQRACCTGTLEHAAAGVGSTCDSGLTLVDGCAGDCTCGGPTAAGQIATQSCVKVETIAEPSTNSSVAPNESGVAGTWTLPQIGPPNGSPLCPFNGVCGYADLHVHMWSNLAHGGATLAGEPWDAAGVNKALAPDYGLDPAVQVANGYTGTLCKDKFSNGQSTGCVARATASCPSYLVNSPLGNLCANQQLFHGDHTLFDTLTGGGTNDSSGNNFGAPAFTGWPQWTSTIHQQVYWKWLERAWLGGLRLMVMDAVTNETLCKTDVRMSGVDCSLGMAQIDLQLNAAKAFQTWLDGQYGGAGKGWFRIVTDPLQATAAIQQGKLAVVLGIEVDNLFNCHYGSDTGQPLSGEGPVCTQAYVQTQLQNYYNMGVRHIFPIHNFDNAFGAPAAWQDAINVGNFAAEGLFWDAANCSDNGNTGYGFYLDPVYENLQVFLGFGLDVQPHYPTPPWAACHAGQGLTDLGKYMIQQAMNMGMIIDVDHMSITSFKDTIALAQSQSKWYSGISATHVQFFDRYQQNFVSNFGRHERMRTHSQLESIKSLGGNIAVMLKDDVQDTSNGFCLPGVSILNCLPAPLGTKPIGGQYTIDYNGMKNTCRYSTTEWAQMYRFGVDQMGGAVAMGSDFNGVAGHVGPRFGSAACGGEPKQRTSQEAANNRLSYPFTLQGFGTFDRQQSGQRTFDFNYDGLAHIGLLPDMVADLRNVGLTDGQLQPLFGSAQAYINSWMGVAKIAPQITSAATATFPEQVAGTTFAVTAAGLPAPALSVSGALPTGITFNGTAFTGTAGANTLGTYPLTISASNGVSPNATQSFSLVVGPTPGFDNELSTVFLVGQPNSFTFHLVSRLNGGRIAGTLPTNVVVDQPLASGDLILHGNPPAGSGGVYPLTEITQFLGIDLTSPPPQPFVLNVYETPSITSGASLSATIGSPVSFQVLANGFPSATFSITGALPAGVVFDTTTGRFVGTPQTGSAGSYPVTLAASNAAGVGTQSFSITVNGPPIITSANNATWTAGFNNQFSVMASGFPAPQISFSAPSPAASWLVVFLPNTLTGMPTAADLGKFTVTVTATNSFGSAMQSFTLIVKANATITWNTPAAIPYGTALSGTQLNATASINGVTVPGSFVYTPAAGTVLELGANPLSVTFTPTDTTKYFIETSEVILNVLKATPTITWANPSNITYGTALSGTQLNATAKVGGTTVAGTFTYTPAAGAILGAGNQTLSVTFTPTDTVHFNAAGGTAGLMVNKAPLTFTAASFTRVWGQPNPAFTYAVGGFVNSENASVLSGAPALSTAAIPTTLPGVYPITITQNTLAAANYSFNFVNGALTITPTGAAPASGTTCNGAYTGTFKGDVTVPSGQYCIFLTGAEVTGNLTSTGGTVILVGATVDHNVDANGGALTITGGGVGGNLTIQTGKTVFNIGPSTKIAHNLQIQKLPANTVRSTVCGVSVGGNLMFQNNAAPVAIGDGTAACPGNTVDGNMLIQSNSAAIVINGNTVTGNLNDQDNTGPEQVLNNKIGDHLQCSGNTSITGSGNTAKSKNGQCSLF